MGLFDKLFKRPNPQQPRTQDSPNRRYEAVTSRTSIEVSRAARMALLSKLSRSIVDEGVRTYWNGVVGSVDEAVQLMLGDGTLVPASASEKLSKLHTVPQLKDMLRAAGGKPSGKKADIINALVAATPSTEHDRLVGEVEYYTVTAAGKEAMETFYAEMGTARTRVEEESYNLILAGDTKEAHATWLRFLRDYDAEETSRLNALPPELVGVPSGATYMLDDSLYGDLNHSAEEKRAIRAGMVFASMIGGSMRGAELAFRHTAGEFRCPSLEEFLRSPQCESFAASYDADDPMSRFDLYHHTKSMAALQADNLKQLLADAGAEGVEILPVEGCSLCNKGKLVYRRSELSKMPRLPRHWGCRCTYLPFLT